MHSIANGMMDKPRAILLVGAVAASMTVIGCGADQSPIAVVPASMIVVSGDAQQATVNTELASAVVVRVVDAAGVAVTNQIVNFRVVSGGGSAFAGAAITNNAGEARERWTLGQVAADSQRLEARAVDAATGTALVFATFRATAVAGAAAKLVKASTDGGQATIGTVVAIAPSVKVLDQFDNPVSGTAVAFAVASGGGGVTGATQSSSSAGVATVGAWTLGTTPGVNTVTATSTGLTGSPITFTATGAGATQLALTTSAAGAASGVAFTTQPVVALRDASGNTVVSDNSSVVTMTASAGATVVGTATTTAVAGVATFTSVGISGTAGTTYTVVFTAGGLTSVSQSILLTAGLPATMTVSPASAGIVPAQTQQLNATLRDASGNAISGSITWSSSNTAVATVSTTGLVTAVAVGSTTVSATGSGKVGTAIITVVAPFTSLATREGGGGHTCALTGAGAAYCWGLNTYGEIGDGTTTARYTPAALQSGLVSFTSLTAGYDFTCGLTGAGAAYCWGLNNASPFAGEASGELGDGTGIDRLTPVAVQGGVVFTSIASGEFHTCGLTSGGAAYCWGSNFNTQLGDGTNITRLSPTAVQGGLTFTALASGDEHTCGLTTANVLYCWGANTDGRLGDGTTTARASPVLVQGGLAFTAVSTGTAETCALTNAGAAYCWGGNLSAEIGDGTTTDRHTPTAVQGAPPFVAITTGFRHACGLTSAGAAYCWGNNDDGELGDGTTDQRASPVAVQGGLTFTSLSAGGTRTCALTSAGVAYCWGTNAFGALGNGTTTNSSTPVAVSRP